jgi:hypothetical protein
MTNREVLPSRRFTETFDILFDGQRYTISFGRYDRRKDARIGEVFISAAKVGSGVEAVARDSAILLSLAMQHGIPIETMRQAITREHDGSPSTIIGCVLDRLGKN